MPVIFVGPGISSCCIHWVHRVHQTTKHEASSVFWGSWILVCVCGYRKPTIDQSEPALHWVMVALVLMVVIDVMVLILAW